MASTCFSLPDRIRDRAAGAASEGLGAELPGGLEERWEGRLLCFEAGSWRHCCILAVGSTIARHKSSPLSAGSSPSHAQCSRLRSGLFHHEREPSRRDQETRDTSEGCFTQCSRKGLDCMAKWAWKGSRGVRGCASSLLYPRGSPSVSVSVSLSLMHVCLS